MYGYAGGSPQRRVDPNGLISLPPKPPGAGSLVCEAGLKDLACKFVLRYGAGLGKFAALNICSSQGDTSSGGSPQSGPPTKPTKDEVRDLKDLFGQGPDGASDALRQLEDGTKQVPPTLTRDALENYAKIARDQIAKGLDGSSVQATRLKIIERILGK